MDYTNTCLDWGSDNSKKDEVLQQQKSITKRFNLFFMKANQCNHEIYFNKIIKMMISALSNKWDWESTQIYLIWKLDESLISQEHISAISFWLMQRWVLCTEMLLHLIEMSLIINVLKKSIFQNIDFQQIGWDEVFGQIGICIL